MTERWFREGDPVIVGDETAVVHRVYANGNFVLERGGQQYRPTGAPAGACSGFTDRRPRVVPATPENEARRQRRVALRQIRARARDIASVARHVAAEPELVLSSPELRAALLGLIDAYKNMTAEKEQGE